MNNIIKNKKLSITVLSVIAILSITLGIGLIAKLSSDKSSSLVAVTDKVIDENGNALNDGKIHEMPHTMLFAPKSGLLSSGNEPMKAIVSASVYPQNAVNKAVDWDLEFVNAESEWASGKNISDYVTVTPVSDGSPVAEISCLQAFGEQIKLTVTSRNNPDAKLFCLVDYKQQYTGFSISLSQTGKTPSVNNDTKKGTVYADFENEDPLLVAFSYVKSDVYTVAMSDNEITAPTVSVEYKSALTTALNAVKANAAKTPTITPTGNGYEVGLLLKDFVAGYTASETNGIINALDRNKSSGIIFYFGDENGNSLATYTFTIDVTAIKTQLKVESVTLDKTGIIFGEEKAVYNITYKKAGANAGDLTLFDVGSEYGLSKSSDGYYPETYTYGEAVNISNLKARFSCGGPGSDYHSGGGSGNAGYAFKGWYLDSAKTIAFDGVIPAGTIGDITLYADIEATSTHFY